ncbi:hypothetical protein D9V34_09465 [Mycetocola lacteus]|uniref:Uncharacterized protein n=1 Tax=Mycetocola lacteus TaxID=76637 RepID=A0A3L7AQX2_9MICO|nr:hypothetical protein D9V34_09465 [Mycetocola lacteus]
MVLKMALVRLNLEQALAPLAEGAAKKTRRGLRFRAVRMFARYRAAVVTVTGLVVVSGVLALMLVVGRVRIRR